MPSVEVQQELPSLQVLYLQGLRVLIMQVYSLLVAHQQ